MLMYGWRDYKKMIKNGKNYISKSGFNLYNMCGIKYKLKYIDKLPSPKSVYQEVADFGNIIHKSIENIKDNIIIDKIIKPKKTYVKNKSIMVNDKIYDLDESKHMNNFFKFTNSLFKKSKDIKYSIPIETEGHYFNDELRIHGFIDAVYKHYKDDKIILVDWKTGKEKEDDVCRSEMLFYALCWNYSHKEKVKYIKMVFTKNNHVFFEEITDKMLKNFSEEIRIVHKMIDNEIFLKAMKIGYFDPCKYCEYKGKGCDGRLVK